MLQNAVFCDDILKKPGALPLDTTGGLMRPPDPPPPSPRIIFLQSLEFVAETRILSEMKIKNRGKKYFPRKNKLTSIFFFFKQPVAVAESMEITTLVPSKIDRGPLMELLFVEICIFQAISVTEVYGRS